MSAREKLPFVGLLCALALALVAGDCNGDGWNFNEGFADDPHLLAVAFADDAYVTVGQDYTIANSADGEEFLRQSLDCCGSLFAVTFGNGKWVVAGDQGVVYTSTDSANWFFQFLPTSRSIRGADYGVGTYVLVGEDGRILSSTNAGAWAVETSGTDFDLNDVVFADGLFVSVGDRGVDPDVPRRRGLDKANFGRRARTCVASAGVMISSSPSATTGRS